MQLEKRGAVTATVCSAPFLKPAKAQAQHEGMPSVPFVKILHPMATAPLEAVGNQVKEALPQITQALTVTREQEEKQISQNDGGENLLTIKGGVEEVFELLHEQGWKDGITIFPPTETTVRAMLSPSVYAPDTILGSVPPGTNPL